MAEQAPDHSTLRRIYEEILPLFRKAAIGQWVYFQNPEVERMEQGHPQVPDTCPPRMQGDVRCWQLVEGDVSGAGSCLPVACRECAVWKAARPTLVEELGEAFNSLMFRLCRQDESLTRAASLTRDLAAQWEGLELENRAIRESMSRDSLTGLLNRQQLDLDLVAAVASRGRRQRPLTLAMFDIDHFKDFNDTYGHPEGDKVLAACGRLLEETTRQEDRCYRYGGEEFVVLFQDTPLPVAQGIAERLRRRFAQLGFRISCADGQSRRENKTISGGLAQYVPGMEPIRLVALADAALYEAKHQGRNRIVVATTVEEEGARDPEPAIPLSDG